MSSGSRTFTLSDDGKKALLINHLQQLTATIYIERVKLRMVQKKALTSGDKQFGQMHQLQRGKVAVLEAEREHFIDEYQTLSSKKPAAPAEEAK